jgi:hypothetical protein
MLADVAHDVSQMLMDQAETTAKLVRQRSRDISELEVHEWFTVDVRTWKAEDSVRIIREACYEPDGYSVVEAAEATHDWEAALGVIAQDAYRTTAESETAYQLEKLVDVVDELVHQHPDQMEFIEDRTEEIVVGQLHGQETELQFSRLGCVRVNG